MFTPQVHQELSIDGRLFRVAAHPSATGMPHGQEGRAAVVYTLVAADHAWAGPVRVLRERGAPFQVPLDGTPVRIGRGPRNEVVLEEPPVSREHGALVVQNGNLFFWDNSSRNGTLLDGERLEPQKWIPVPPGSRLQLGALEQGVPLAVRPDPAASRALKVFKSRFRVPRLVEVSERLAPFAELPGLRVCARRVLTPQEHRDLLASEPELVYAALMPWIEGRTWMEHLLERVLLAPEQALALAGSFLDVMARLEQRGIAHCDLSGPNVAVVDGPAVELLDVEQLHGPGLDPPEDMFAGSPGYAHRNLGDAAWSEVSDRFSGAILAAEMLAWCDPVMAEAASSESFFDPGELHVDSQRFRHLCGFLESRWGAGVARLLERAWLSESPADCPTFGEWLVALPSPGRSWSPPPEPPPVEEPAPEPFVPVAPAVAADPMPMVPAPPQMERARLLEEAGDAAGALAAYRDALAAVPADSAVGRELALIVGQLEATAAPRVPEPAPAPAPAPVDPDLVARIRELEGPPGIPEAPPPAPKGPLHLGIMAFLLLVAGLGSLGLLILGGLYLWRNHAP